MAVTFVMLPCGCRVVRDDQRGATAIFWPSGGQATARMWVQCHAPWGVNFLRPGVPPAAETPG